MDLHDALHTRRTIHRYTLDDVPDDAVRRALAAANQAPNHRHTWPWRFTVVGREPRKPIADLAVTLKTRPDTLLRADAVEAIRAKILNPAWLVVARRVRHESEAIEREDYAAVACAIQNLQLALHADGIGSKWSSGRVTRDPRTYAHLDIDEATEEIVGFIWVGIPLDTHKAPPRPDIDTLVTWRR